MATKFEDFMKEIEAEAEAEGPGAVDELRFLRAQMRRSPWYCSDILESLVSLLKHHEASIRMAAIQALETTDIKDSIVWTALSNVVRFDINPVVRSHALQALNELFGEGHGDDPDVWKATRQYDDATTGDEMGAALAAFAGLDDGIERALRFLDASGKVEDGPIMFLSRAVTPDQFIKLWGDGQHSDKRRATLMMLATIVVHEAHDEKRVWFVDLFRKGLQDPSRDVQDLADDGLQQLQDPSEVS